MLAKCDFLVLCLATIILERLWRGRDIDDQVGIFRFCHFLRGEEYVEHGKDDEEVDGEVGASEQVHNIWIFAVQFPSEI